MKPLIYCAGPYSADTEQGRLENTKRAMDVALELIDRGYYPYAPHLSHFLDTHAQEKGIELPWEFWMEYNDVWLTKCDALFFIGESRGACIELERAKELGLQIFYSVEEVPDLGVEE